MDKKEKTPETLGTTALNPEEALKRIEQLEDALMLMVHQYCVTDEKLDHRYMCAGEHAFAALGLKNGDSVEKLEKMMDSTEYDPEPLHPHSLPKVKMALADLSRYAREKGVSVSDLTEEEKNRFGVFTQKP